MSEKEDEFTLYLKSDDSLNYYPLNCQNSFIVKLEKTIDVQNHTEWQLALTEIIYPNAIATLHGEQVCVYRDGIVHKIIKYPTVRCSTLKELVNILNDSGKSFYQFQLNEHLQRLKLKTKSPYTLQLDQLLCDILCFDQTKFLPGTTVLSSDCPSLIRHIDYLYVYTNIGQYVIVGDKKVPLLRYFPFSSSSSSTSTKAQNNSKSFSTLLYVGLVKSHIEHIEVSIRDGAGQLVPFVGENHASSSLQLVINFQPIHRRRY